MCPKINIPANSPWIDVTSVKAMEMPNGSDYSKDWEGMPLIDPFSITYTTTPYPPAQEVPDAITKEQIYEVYGVPNATPPEYLEDLKIQFNQWAGVPVADVKVAYTTDTQESADVVTRVLGTEKGGQDVSINIPSREPVTRDLKVDLSGVTNLSTQGAIKKIFEGLNGRGEAKPVLADPEKLARLLTIGLTRLQENLISKELGSDVVDLVMEEVATSFEYIILLARESGMIKVLLLKEDPPAIYKKKRTVIFGATNLEED